MFKRQFINRKQNRFTAIRPVEHRWGTRRPVDCRDEHETDLVDEPCAQKSAVEVPATLKKEGRKPKFTVEDCERLLEVDFGLVRMGTPMAPPRARAHGTVVICDIR